MDAPLREGGQGEGAFVGPCINQLRSIFGTGLLAMPWAFAHIGLLSGTVLTLLVGALSCYTMVLIARCVLIVDQDNCGAPRSYGDYVVVALGRRAGAVAGTNLVIHQILCCSAYLTFIGDNVHKVLGVATSIVVVTAAVPFALLCLARHLGFLRPVSAVGNVLLIFVVGSVLIQGAQLQPHHPAPPLASVSPSALANFLGVCIFTFCGHSETTAITVSMGPCAPRYWQVMLAVLILGVPMIAGFSGLALVEYGSEVSRNVLLGLQAPLSDAVLLAMSAVAFCSLPVKMFPATELLEALLPARTPCLGRSAMRICCALAAAAAAVSIPDFAFLLAFTGSSCMGIIAFILPPAMYLGLKRGQLSSVQLLLHRLLLLLGCCIFVGATFKVVVDKVTDKLTAELTMF